MKALITGPDEDGLAPALETEGIDVTFVEGIATADSLAAAGLDDADLLVVTDVDDATAIAVAKDERPDLKVVVYARETLPEFAKGQADLAVDPRLLDPDVVAEELAGQ